MNGYMEEALKEAVLAEAEGEIHVGGVAVMEGRVVARGHNRTIGEKDPTAHAEIQLLREVARNFGNHRLNELEIYVTKEPCIMCIGALVQARVKKVAFGAYDALRGGVDIYLRYSEKFNHRIVFEPEVEMERCEALLTEFFHKRRGTEAVVTGSTRNRFSG